MNIETKEVFKDILSEKEVLEIQKFIDNPAMKEAIRKVLHFKIQSSGILEAGKPAGKINFALNLCVEEDDEKLGNKLRTIFEALMIVETAFADLEKFRKIEKAKVEKINPAR